MTRQKKPEVEEKASSYILNIVCISMMQICNILLEGETKKNVLRKNGLFEV